MTADLVRARARWDYYPAFDVDPSVRNPGEFRRDPNSIHAACIHATAADNSIRSTGAWFKFPDAGSTHEGVDEEVALRFALDADVVAGASGFNTNGWHIEQRGLATWTRADWLRADRAPTVQRCAFRVALVVVRYKLPKGRLGPEDLRAGRSGWWTTHNDVHLAFGLTPHTDPGPGYPEDVFEEFLTGFVEEDDPMGLSTEDRALLEATKEAAERAATAAEVSSSFLGNFRDAIAGGGGRAGALLLKAAGVETKPAAGLGSGGDHKPEPAGGVKHDPPPER